MQARYLKNLPALSEAECALLGEKRVLVAGCGGLGGWVLELLSRLGVGHITAVDGDSFEPSNQNRQLLATEGSLGKSKALTAARRLSRVNPDVSVTPVAEFITKRNCRALIRGHDAVVDALDTARCKLLLASACSRENVWLIHGAVSGFNGQVAAVSPKSGLIGRLYSGGEPESEGALSFTACCAASLMACETAKLLIGREVRSGLLTFDLSGGDFGRIEL